MRSHFIPPCPLELLAAVVCVFFIALPAAAAQAGAQTVAQRETGAQAEARDTDAPVGPRRAAAIAALPPLRCKLRRIDPVLDFEFRFVAPFAIDIPLKRLAGGGLKLRTTIVVRPLSVEGAEPFQSEDTYTLPKEIPPEAKGEIELSSSVAMGEGQYAVEWRLEDEVGRSCELQWKLEAKLSRRARDVDMTMDPGEVAPGGVYLFRPERSVKSGDGGLRLKLLMNLDVFSRRRARVQLWRYAPMISGLRVMARNPELGKFAVVAFSLEQQQVLHRQEFSGRIRFPAIGRAIESLSPGTVEVKTLRKGSDLEFLDRLLAEELDDDEPVDAFVFLGADDRFGMKVSPEVLARVRKKNIPVFHFNSTPYLWRGAIGNAVRALGGREFRVEQPQDLAEAVDKLVTEISARRHP